MKESGHDLRMASSRRLTDLFRFPGFRPYATKARGVGRPEGACPALGPAWINPLRGLRHACARHLRPQGSPGSRSVLRGCTHRPSQGRQVEITSSWGCCASSPVLAIPRGRIILSPDQLPSDSHCPAAQGAAGKPTNRASTRSHQLISPQGVIAVAAPDFRSRSCGLCPEQRPTGLAPQSLHTTKSVLRDSTRHRRYLVPSS
jgi:hypothetical protein